MCDMKDHYDFSNGKKNPYADKMKDGYTVKIFYEAVKRGAKSQDSDDDKETRNSAPGISDEPVRQ